jgi:dTDP-4-amino-4,6-dideoxygalactose transaminase
MKKYITFGSPAIGKEEINAVTKCMKSGWIGTGPLVKKFENNFANYSKSKYAIAVGSCTAALHLSLNSISLNKGDEVIVPAMTFCSTVNSIIHSGYKPVLADVNFNTMNIDPEEIEKKISKKTKALVIVHFAGRPCDMDKITSIVKKYNLILIEDCAHAIEGSYKGKKCGTFGMYGCFSFYVTKNLVTAEGGMILSNNKEKIDPIKQRALHGMSKDAWKRFSDNGYKHYDIIDAGFKYNMTDIQAAIGLQQLKKIKKHLKIRDKIWEEYQNFFKNYEIKTPDKIENNTTHAKHLYTILIDKKKLGITRDEFMMKLHTNGVGTGVHYRSIPSHTFYKKKFKWKQSDYKNSSLIGDQTVSLPLSPNLTKKNFDKILHTIEKVLKN